MITTSSLHAHINIKWERMMSHMYVLKSLWYTVVRKKPYKWITSEVPEKQKEGHGKRGGSLWVWYGTLFSWRQDMCKAVRGRGSVVSWLSDGASLNMARPMVWSTKRGRHLSLEGEKEVMRRSLLPKVLAHWSSTGDRTISPMCSVLLKRWVRTGSYVWRVAIGGWVGEKAKGRSEAIFDRSSSCPNKQGKPNFVVVMHYNLPDYSIAKFPFPFSFASERSYHKKIIKHFESRRPL